MNTICIILGPYRNLTTLTASCCMLHNQVQVLNHGPYINENNKTNFLVQYSKNKVDNFIKEVLRIACDEEVIPGKGGIITASHAFKNYKIMQNVFNNKFSKISKDDTKSIVWKDSHKNTNILLKNNNLKNLLHMDNRLKFLLPIRNPIDCAISNSNFDVSAHKKYFCKNKRREDILKSLFDIYKWFFEFENKYQDRFFSFFEFESMYFIDRFEKFACIDTDVQWKKDVENVWTIKKSYKYSNNLKKIYANNLENIYVKLIDSKICNEKRANFYNFVQ